MKILGLIKTTLLDYPGHVSATVFLGGCNFLCPFCHNKSLVIPSEGEEVLHKEDVLDFLQKRVGILEGVCITGGEPTLNNELIDFIRTIKKMGYKIKLDTNGTNPQMINSLYQEDLLDYIAMDIKNSPTNYLKTVGLTHFNFDHICQSVAWLKNNYIPYEFRTTIVKELHTHDDIKEIGKWLDGCTNYYLQNFKPSENQIVPGYSSHSKEILEEFMKILKPFINNIKIRGL
ncbi:pyruvate formate lyase activating enzyme [Natranaerovirga pectinivora]|uniref:Pyruvate formate lyase activating enzyme n=1 Tax=Natranaerovirga pectinivora TaxID=682400 RepID=A0A4R3MET2_9FIRM|nr:anaerobic ribonucleoside-triphosphate reductase activating protein [Natranaerovirga pectinivora]TCT11662.1 pyruvate formate lyase activating enzyme [Natranaerovirga pectinivora]